MLVPMICGLVLYGLAKIFFYQEDTHRDSNDIDSSHSDALFDVAKRLEKLYKGSSKVHVGLQIPDPDSASRQNIDLVLVTHREAVVISVKNISGVVSIDKDGNWMCTNDKNHTTETIPNPVMETKKLVSILEEYLEQRGVALPEGYLSFKVICPNPNFRSIDSDSLPPEVVTYDRWEKWQVQETFSEKLNVVLSTAPVWDRLELEGNKYVLGEFVEFKGKQEDQHALRKITRSKVSRVTVQKTRMLDFAHPTVEVLCAPRDYRVEGSSSSSSSSQCEKVIVRSSTEVVFRPQNSEKPCKYKLSSVISMLLSG
ncbi:hypothetical protein BUALT_Bualt06G0128800 [Buddleja alternifolia]|uniref:NERD domain-containing protein n=1 Tax=Buddleja alternifolia TaxID=168488 RepID=A0AAV6XQM3_9LAMI|nr:hypothetical protein BUALT_Bualt06G0128800 [Buddleja alternifolia]